MMAPGVCAVLVSSSGPLQRVAEGFFASIRAARGARWWQWLPLCQGCVLE